MDSEPEGEGEGEGGKPGDEINKAVQEVPVTVVEP